MSFLEKYKKHYNKMMDVCINNKTNSSNSSTLQHIRLNNYKDTILTIIQLLYKINYVFK